jgi:SAM-dependent methyltransferase
MGKTLSGQFSWFTEQIRAVKDKNNLSILISGCADYSAFAHVIAALNLTESQPHGHPRIVAVDRCETPLRLNQYLSERTGVEIATIKTDLLSFSTHERFDLIFTSSFLGYFDPPTRNDLFRQYHHLLKPRGRLVFANRLRDGQESELVASSAETVSRTTTSALELHRAAKLEPKMDESEFIKRVTTFVQHNASYPLNSAQTVAAYLQQAGFFRFDIKLRQADLPIHAAPLHFSGTGLAENATYVCVRAERS